MQNESKRQKQVAKQLQKDLGEIFQHQNIGKSALVTVTVIKVSPDLGLARVYLSVFPVVKQQAVLEQVNDRAGVLRQELAKRVRHQLRKVPQLEYYIDNTEEEAAYINNLIDNLDIPPPSEEKSDNEDYNEDEF